MGKGVGFLWWQADAVEDRLCGLKLGDKGEDSDFSPTQGTQQGVDLVDFSEHFGPAEPALPVPRGLLLGVNVWRGRSGASKLGIVQAAQAQALAERLKERLQKGDDIRELIVDDYLVLYLVRGKDVVFLSIKHHRQLSYDLKAFWR
jgi:hypothetical protein